ncbi:hypothetical protein PLICRDRAFT_170457 [Plicaturopsis crispa FD-325 SS-3]|nr:hypothetical protein PLICRDRAFT_170457 [Plicaturopsis crispa FD-325 SS-3]
MSHPDLNIGTKRPSGDVRRNAARRLGRRVNEMFAFPSSRQSDGPGGAENSRIVGAASARRRLDGENSETVEESTSNAGQSVGINAAFAIPQPPLGFEGPLSGERKLATTRSSPAHSAAAVHNPDFSLPQPPVRPYSAKRGTINPAFTVPEPPHAKTINSAFSLPEPPHGTIINSSFSLPEPPHGETVNRAFSIPEPPTRGGINPDFALPEPPQDGTINSAFSLPEPPQQGAINPAFALPEPPHAETINTAFSLPEPPQIGKTFFNKDFALPVPTARTSGSQRGGRDYFNPVQPGVRFSEALAVKSVARVADIGASEDETESEDGGSSDDTEMADVSVDREGSVDVPESTIDAESDEDSSSSDSSIEVSEVRERIDPEGLKELSEVYEQYNLSMQNGGEPGWDALDTLLCIKQGSRW